MESLFELALECWSRVFFLVQISNCSMYENGLPFAYRKKNLSAETIFPHSSFTLALILVDPTIKLSNFLDEDLKLIEEFTLD